MTGYALIACTKQKRPYRCQAYELYDASPLFRKAWRHCRREELQVLILSAKYGLVDPTTELEPYELTLKTMGISERRAWAREVSRSLRSQIPAGTRIELHAGRDYTANLDLSGYIVADPLSGLRLGERLGWYDTTAR